ncbi:MAG TPA: isoprenylcysteine carboxylmethyltransferase family protein [Candidatus Baltobacteraceae bacterium]|jgi:protein-S-isoprenylcysteine O-methyltransferase Ste14
MGVRAFVFKNRGALLAIPALILAIFGKPNLTSILAGLPLALAGEAIRCWAVGYSGTTTRADQVTAPQLVTAGPYAYVRNPLYIGNFLTALGFAIAFTGNNSETDRYVLIVISLAMMLAIYITIVPHEENFLRATFGASFDEYASRVARVWPRIPKASASRMGSYDAGVIVRAETRTFVTFGVMLAILGFKAVVS